MTTGEHNRLKQLPWIFYTNTLACFNFHSPLNIQWLKRKLSLCLSGTHIWHFMAFSTVGGWDGFLPLHFHHFLKFGLGQRGATTSRSWGLSKWNSLQQKRTEPDNLSSRYLEIIYPRLLAALGCFSILCCSTKNCSQTLILLNDAGTLR